MTNNSYLKLLRQYAALTRRLGVTYWEAVDTLYESRVKSALVDVKELQERQRIEDDLEAVFKTEYPFER